MIRIKQFLIALIAYVSPAVALACGNEYYHHQLLPVDKTGKLSLDAILRHTNGGKIGYYPYWQNGKYSKNDIIKQLNWLSQKIDARAALLTVGPSLRWVDLEKALQRNVSYELLSDYAWNELRVGNKENAVKLLERLYAKHPNEYNIVANLGTAYEVTGKDAKALEYLKKAVAINAASHYNSEWIHIKILEQKLSTKPDYKTIIGLKAGEDYTAWLVTKKNGT
ncbi:MAG TPA: BTAD domain-containing putative transcriptional regulator, partial [Chitinophagaceae bacterium]|nr:BTAD domain-containing putative transcriptional regulator [Chitinophagaceae bacterium]